MRACQKVQELYSLTQRKDEAPAPENAKTEEDFILAETEVETQSGKIFVAEIPAETNLTNSAAAKEQPFDFGTQKTLDSLKKEWRELDNITTRNTQNEDLTYPFGGWTDAENYQK